MTEEAKLSHGIVLQHLLSMDKNLAVYQQKTKVLTLGKTTPTIAELIKFFQTYSPTKIPAIMADSDAAPAPAKKPVAAKKAASLSSKDRDSEVEQKKPVSRKKRKK